MSPAKTFCTYKYYKRFKEVGFSEQQSEALVYSLVEVIKLLENNNRDMTANNLTTKKDLKECLAYKLTFESATLIIAGITAFIILVAILSKLH